MSVDMQVKLGSLLMKNPVTTASGTFASGREYNEFCDIEALGALTTKGVSLHAWQGNKTPRIAETPSGMLNSIGLQNPGVEAFIEGDLAWLATKNVPVIVNVSGHSFDEYAQVVEALDAAGGADAYEINVSCPNVDAGGMVFGTDPASIEKIVLACRKKTAKTLIVKLTPNVTHISGIARAAEAAGADALSLINTVLGMAINAQTRTPELARVVGGLSGPAIKPIALRAVYECYRAVHIPLIGMGGIVSAEDAIEFMLAGARAIAVGSANFINPCATVDVIKGIEAYAIGQGVDNINDIVGGLIC